MPLQRGRKNSMTIINMLGEKIKLTKVEGSQCEETGYCDWIVTLLEQGSSRNQMVGLGKVGSGWFRNGGWGWAPYSKYTKPFGSETRRQAVKHLVENYFRSIGDKPAIWKTEANSKIKTSYDLG